MADSSKAMEVDRPTCRALSLPQQQSQQRRGEGADEEPAHNHLILSPTRGEVHAHGRWHKYVKPRIGMGFQAISIPSVGEGAVEAGDGADGAQRVIGSRTSSASSLGELSAAAQSSGQGPGRGGGGEPQLQQQPTRKSGRKTAGKRSGRSTPSTEGHQSNVSSRRGPSSDAAVPASVVSSGVGSSSGGGGGDKGLRPREKQTNYSIPSDAMTSFPIVKHAAVRLVKVDALPPARMGGVVIHQPHSVRCSGEIGNTNASFLTFARNVTLETPQWRSNRSLDCAEQQFEAEVRARYAGLISGPSSSRTGGKRGSGRRSIGGSQFGSGADGRPKKRGRKSKADKEKELREQLAALEPASLSRDTNSRPRGVVATHKGEELGVNEAQSRSVSPMPPREGGGDNGTKVLVDYVSTYGPTPSLEDDEMMLAYLHGRHGGDMEVARLSLLSHLSMGRAVQARRNMKKQREREEAEGGSLSDMLYPSDVWRRRFERFYTSMTGDLRKSKREAGRYPYGLHDGSGVDMWNAVAVDVEPSTGGVPLSNPSIAPFKYNGTSEGGRDSKHDKYDEEEELRKPWRLALECAEAIVARTAVTPDTNGVTNSSSSIGAISAPKPSLRDLIILLRKAHTLPRPEEVFPKRDTSVKRISTCMNTIIDLVFAARNRLAALNDKIFDEDVDGVVLTELRIHINSLEENSPVVLEEVIAARTMLEAAAQWEERLDRVLAGDLSGMFSLQDYKGKNDNVCVLTAAERMVKKGERLALRPRSLVALKKRVDRALLLRGKLRQTNDEKGDTMKQFSALVREANKIDLAFPEVAALSSTHQAAEEWTDRATVAMRSQMSLMEMVELVESGRGMPVNLSDLLGKLQSRVDEAKEWINDLKEAVPESADLANSSTKAFYADRLKWLKAIRGALTEESESGKKHLLQLASEGLRIPVDMLEHQLLQIEIDARNWTLKAKRWTEKRGKIDDLFDHLAKGEAIRDRVPIDKDEKDRWKLDAEADLQNIVRVADAWYKKYRQYIEGDRRRNRSQIVISLPLLRQIVNELNDIQANLGNPSVKMIRILNQAETWCEENKEILVRFGVSIDIAQKVEGVPNGLDNSAQNSVSMDLSKKITFDQLKEAVDSAASDVSLDLEEALALKKVLNAQQQWFDRATGVASKRSKRLGRSKKKSGQKEAPGKHGLEDLVALVNEAPNLLVDATTHLERINMQLSSIQSWRLQAHATLGEITISLTELRKERTRHLGPPEDFLSSPAAIFVDIEDCDEAKADYQSRDSNAREKLDAVKKEASMDVDPQNDVVSHEDQASTQRSNGNEVASAHVMIANFLRGAQAQEVYTLEEELAELLGKVSEWLAKAAFFILKPARIFKRGNFKEFDEFIDNAKYLLLTAESPDLLHGIEIDGVKVPSDLTTTWSSLVRDEKIRLEKLKDRRDQFKDWEERIHEILMEDEKRLSLDVLKGLLKEGDIYPKAADAVKKLQAIVDVASAWAEKTAALIESSSNAPISMQVAKAYIDEGDKLKITCQEYRVLRNGLRQIRGWILRVKKITAANDEGTTHISDIRDLIAEHKTFLVQMPEEIAKLKDMMCGYCICRKPYDGFMVGCDTCDEWYHGPCIGLTEQQAEKFDKYMCIRCVTQKQYKMCTDTVLNVVRKWTSSKDLAKSRKEFNQRHQRKIREKKRDIEKLKATVDKIAVDLNSLGFDLTEMNQDPSSVARPLPIPVESDLEDRNVSVSDPSRLPSAGIEKAEKEASPAQQGALVPVETKFSDAGTSGLTVAAEPTVLQLNPPVGSQPGATNLSLPAPESRSLVAPLPVIQLREKHKRAQESLANAHRRLVSLHDITKDLKNQEEREDALKDPLRNWCIMLRKYVLITATKEEAEASRPLSNGNISAPMVVIVELAKTNGLADIPDVVDVINSLGCLSWCLRALTLLAKKSAFDDMRACIEANDTGSFKLPEEKCVRMIKPILSRARLWQEKAVRALRPIAGEICPYDVVYLQRILLEVKDIPFIMSEESRLINTIEDKGARHCFCGGPSDGSLMIGCDKCERWFHAKCVDFNSSESFADQSKWMCPSCIAKASGASAAMNGADDLPVPATSVTSTVGSEEYLPPNDPKSIPPEPNAICIADVSNLEGISSTGGPPKEMFDRNDERSPHAPNPDILWPPFGLLHSKTALSALGVACVKDIPDLIGTDNPEEVSAEGVAQDIAPIQKPSPSTGSSPPPEPRPTQEILSPTPLSGKPVDAAPIIISNEMPPPQPRNEDTQIEGGPTLSESEKASLFSALVIDTVARGKVFESSVAGARAPSDSAPAAADGGEDASDQSARVQAQAQGPNPVSTPSKGSPPLKKRFMAAMNSQIAAASEETTAVPTYGGQAKEFGGKVDNEEVTSLRCETMNISPDSFASKAETVSDMRGQAQKEELPMEVSASSSLPEIGKSEAKDNDKAMTDADQ